MSGSILEAGWLPDATCELNPVFPGATWEGGGSANIAQNHQINIPHRVAHRVQKCLKTNSASKFGVRAMSGNSLEAGSRVRLAN